MAVQDFVLPFERNTSPLCQLAFNTGALLSWRFPLPANKLKLCLRFLVIMVIGFGVFFDTAYNIYCLLSSLAKDPSLEQLTAVLAQYLQFPFSLITLVILTRKRKSLYSFFQDWRRLEEPLASSEDSTRISSCYVLSWLICVYITSGVAYHLYFGLQYPHATSQLLRSPFLQNSHCLHLIHITYSWLTFYQLILGEVGYAIPSMTYYYLALSLRKIENSVMFDVALAQKQCGYTSFNHPIYTNASKFNNLFVKGSSKVFQQCDKTSMSHKEAIHQLWSRYDQLNELVKKAGELWNCLMFSSYVTAFFLILGFAFFLLQLLSNVLKGEPLTLGGPDVALPVFYFQLVFIIKLIVFTNMCNLLPNQLVDFKENISGMFNKIRNDLSVEERQHLRDFINHVQIRKWKITPLSTFKVTNGTLLSMTSLVVTYTIVFLQSFK